MSILSSSQWQLQAALSQYLEESLPQTKINKGKEGIWLTLLLISVYPLQNH